jgi:hypothetical protein
MQEQESCQVLKYLDILNEIYKEKERELERTYPDVFSCKGCELLSNCTGHVSKTMITRLNNSLYYDLMYVLIIHHTAMWHQLEVIHLDEILLNEFHEYLEDAKQSFLTKFSHKAIIKDLEPSWATYFPCSDWLEEMIH